MKGREFSGLNSPDASVATTSLYLHVDDERRARQISAAFSEGRP
jgi:hypothetical protein